MNMSVLNNQSLDRKILETDPNLYPHFMRLISTDRYFIKKKKVNNTIHFQTSENAFSLYILYKPYLQFST